MFADVFEPFAVRENVPLAPLTSWRVGGPARYFYEPVGEEYIEVITRARERGIPVYFLGRGTNVLIDDRGIDGLVICTRRALQKLYQQGDLIVAEAGVPLPTLSRFAATLGYGGYEFLIGIPGTVGGGVVMNAGLTSQGVRELSTLLESVDVLDETGGYVKLGKDQLAMGYRTSVLLSRAVLVVRARFRLISRVPPEIIHSTMADHLAERRRKQPLNKWTAGSTFKQPIGGQPAGWYIEKAGLKGFRIGGAVISQKHANWIENTGNATASDIKSLIEYVQMRVSAVFDVWLEREVRFLPDDQSNLLDVRGGRESHFGMGVPEGSQS